MKKRNLILIIAAALIAMAAVIVAITRSRTATFKQDYHIEDTTTVTKLFLADKQGYHVTLTRQTDSTWTVDGTYPANQSMVDLLLETLHDMRIRQQVNKNAIPNAINDLASRAVKAEVYQTTYLIDLFGHRLQLLPQEKLTATYHVGRETQDLMATYMYREGDDVPYIIHIPGFRGFLTPRFPADPLKWRSHTIVDLDVHAIARVELQLPESPQESFAIARDGDQFALYLHNNQRANGFDTARVALMLSSFTWLNFDEFASIVPNTFADSCVSGTPRSILTITDTAGNTHQLCTYIKYNNPDDINNMPDPQLYETFDLDRLYAILDKKDTVLIQYYSFDNILQPVSYFLGANPQK